MRSLSKLMIVTVKKDIVHSTKPVNMHVTRATKAVPFVHNRHQISNLHRLHITTNNEITHRQVTVQEFGRRTK